jgi:uncharacterized OB-fold protein
MKTEEEIKKRLKRIKKKLTCEKCKKIGRIDYDGSVTCPKCKTFLDSDWTDVGIYRALKWVLKDKS